MQKIILAGGCFWAVQHKLDSLEGVLLTKAVYSGGDLPNPTYQQVCSGTTNHVEAVYTEFDEEKISLHKLLDFFFSIHDATQLNRQGPDIGTQYRSAVFCFSERQLKEVKSFVEELQKHSKYSREQIQTQIAMASLFFEAEDYHQNYYKKKGF